MGKVRTVACPRCGKQVAWDPGNAYRPFCSERCKIFDLGAWATEQYRVPVEDEKDEPDSDENR
ncbi:MAG TPA: DNA gyrase inhibitor YacG [Burkholderiales bacterium]